jgi:parallel beta-helix repeat protein
MARHAITIVVIAGIILASTCGLSAEPKELTVLTYNTHLFEDSPLECIVRCGGLAFWLPDPPDWADYNFEDGDRRWWTAAYVRSSGADIVALQEVWSIGYRQWLQSTLFDTYPYFRHLDSSCYCRNALNGINSTLDTCITLSASFPWLYLPAGGPDYDNRFHTQGNGLLLLSKWPLQDIQFTKFPAFNCDLKNPETECWADKGVLTATVDVNGVPIRIGISHALTGPDDYKSKWDRDYVPTAITTFQLNGEAHIFALDSNNKGHIVRIEDYRRWWDEKNKKYNYGAGWKDVYTGTWGSEYVAVTSFELDGHPYLFGLNKNNQARITGINDDPSTGWSEVCSGVWDSNYVSVTSFELDGHPYLFSVHDQNDDAHIYRINDDLSTGWSEVCSGVWDSNYVSVTSFELDGHPYLFSVHDQNDDAHIYRINDNPWGWSDVYDGNWPAGYNDTMSFELDSHPYIFTYNNSNHWAYIYRINDDPWGWSDVYDGNMVFTDYIAVKSFEMNGHPYLFGLRNCCAQDMGPCGQPLPGEAYLKRIDDDPTTGWENLLQLEDIKIIRDATVLDEDGPPAIMMGDFNIHRGKYGIMDQLFRKAGAVDAYIEVHGTGDGGETIDWYNNKLTPHFWSDPKGDPDAVDRIDYVYVKQSGAGLRLVPTEAHVIRNWKYGGDNMDLSDHYPLAVKFKIFQGGCTARMKGDLNCDRLINCADLAILCSAWMSGPNDISWDPACDIGDPPDDFIDMNDIDAFARAWLTVPAVHNVTQNEWYEFIQTAITYASDGDEIEVAPGIYYEAINFRHKGIRLYSSGGPEVTTIDGTGNCHVVQCVNGEDANTVLAGFTITGGNATGAGESGYGGGMYNKASSPSVTNCIFRGNKASYGGGMLNDGSSPIMTNCTFSGNSATFGGGMQNVASSPTLTYCTFSGNSATSNSGGMHNVGSSPTLNHCTFSGNTADVHAGAMINAANSSPVMIACTFTENSASSNGGGMYNLASSPSVTNCIFRDNKAVYGGGMLNDASSPTLTYCTFSGNSATSNSGGMHNVGSSPTLNHCTFSGNTADVHAGAMINAANSSPVMIACTFTENSASSNGGGMYNLASSPTLTECTFADNSAGTDGGGMYNTGNSNAVLIGCTFNNNMTYGNNGGGMHNASSNPKLTNCIFSRNIAQKYGGGMFNNAGRPTLTNCIFYENTARTASGGGYANYYGSNSTLINCTVYQNLAGCGLRNWDSTLVVTNCIVWSHYGCEISSDGASSLTVSYSNVQGGGYTGTGNINEWPFFVDPNGGDLRLSSGSPCIDKGSNAAVSGITTDLDGNPRVLDGDDNGTDIVDMGAYEYMPGALSAGSPVNLEACCILAAHWLEGTEPEL